MLAFRRAAKEDIPAVLQIIEEARESLRALGIDQWQSGYPNEETIRADIAAGTSFVAVWDGKAAGTVSVSFGGEETYREITGGAWPDGGNYAVVHRLAVGKPCRRLSIAAFLLEKTEAMCRSRGVPSIRVDTHEGNRPMRGFLAKNGFRRCGVIFLKDGGRRLAYQKPVPASE